VKAPLRVISRRPALFVAIAVGLGVGVLLPGELPAVKRALIGWCLGTSLFIGFASWSLARCGMAEFRRRVCDGRARRVDPKRTPRPHPWWELPGIERVDLCWDRRHEKVQ